MEGIARQKTYTSSIGTPMLTIQSSCIAALLMLRKMLEAFKANTSVLPMLLEQVIEVMLVVGTVSQLVVCLMR